MNWNAVGALVGALVLLVGAVVSVVVGEIFSAILALGFASLAWAVLAVGDVLSRRE